MSEKMKVHRIFIALELEDNKLYGVKVNQEYASAITKVITPFCGNGKAVEIYPLPEGCKLMKVQDV